MLANIILFGIILQRVAFAEFVWKIAPLLSVATAQFSRPPAPEKSLRECAHLRPRLDHRVTIAASRAQLKLLLINIWVPLSLEADGRYTRSCGDYPASWSSSGVHACFLAAVRLVQTGRQLPLCKKQHALVAISETKERHVCTGGVRDPDICIQLGAA